MGVFMSRGRDIERWLDEPGLQHAVTCPPFRPVDLARARAQSDARWGTNWEMNRSEPPSPQQVEMHSVKAERTGDSDVAECFTVPKRVPGVRISPGGHLTCANAPVKIYAINRSSDPRFRSRYAPGAVQTVRNHVR
jgi:hypothetical protein